MNQDLKGLRKQLEQLQAQHRAGKLDDAQFRSAREALEQRIVQAVMGGAAPPAAAATPAAAPPAVPAAGARVPVRLWLPVAAFTLVVGALGYLWTGTPEQLGATPPGFDTAGGGSASAPHSLTREQFDTIVARLAARLREQPDDVDGWSMLGRSQLALGRPAEAVAAYRKAIALRPDDATLLADFADALATANNRSLEGEPTQLVERALRIDPDSVKALALAGTIAFQKGDFAGAAKHWDRAVAVGPADNPLVQLARDGAAEARERGKLPPPAPGSTAPAAAAKGPATTAVAAATTPASAAAGSITGTVRLADALKGKAAPGDTVFVFARPAEGAGMPLALVRLRVGDLPASFTLDDSQAMTPATKLSSASRVVVAARISKSGQAMPAAGDLEGASAPVAPGARGVTVEIATVRP